jgi:hypothetical protein
MTAPGVSKRSLETRLHYISSRPSPGPRTLQHIQAFACGPQLRGFRFRIQASGDHMKPASRVSWHFQGGIDALRGTVVSI